jgi:hypothetical protein
MRLQYNALMVRRLSLASLRVLCLLLIVPLTVLLVVVTVSSPFFGESLSLAHPLPTRVRRGGRLLLFRQMMGQDSANNNPGSSKDTLGGKVIEFELHQSIDSIPAEAWNSFLGPNSSPFMEYSVCIAFYVELCLLCFIFVLFQYHYWYYYYHILLGFFVVFSYFCP